MIQAIKEIGTGIFLIVATGFFLAAMFHLATGDIPPTIIWLIGSVIAYMLAGFCWKLEKQDAGH